MFMNKNNLNIDNDIVGNPRSHFCVQGMGGQHGYCGFWLDPDYGSGHSRARPRCSTYDSPQLSGKENFALSDIEVWAVTAPRVERRSSDADQVTYLLNHRFT
jgi:hypothetical protein